MDQHRLAAQQFGAAAASYLTSAVHAQGADLQRIAGLARSGLAALDLGCGGGHASYALAAAGADVAAYDLSAEMLGVVAAEAERRGLHNLRAVRGPAERLPFGDATFDVVVSRFSAHHWLDVPAGLREARRVLKPEGILVFIDVLGPETPLFDTVLQTLEILRDGSHVRDYRASEWRAMLVAAGFADPGEIDTWPLPMVFDTWVARSSTPEVRVRALRDVMDRAPAEAQAHFSMQPDGSFEITVGWMQTRPAG